MEIGPSGVQFGLLSYQWVPFVSLDEMLHSMLASFAWRGIEIIKEFFILTRKRSFPNMFWKRWHARVLDSKYVWNFIYIIQSERKVMI